MKMMGTNPGCIFDSSFFTNVHINAACVNELALTFSNVDDISGPYRIGWLLKAITCIDLTTLSGDDTLGNVHRLCHQASQPIGSKLLQKLGFDSGLEDAFKTAAICVYPSRVHDVITTLTAMDLTDMIHIASVATGFPSGQTPLNTRLDEIKFAIDMGADEIDVVINRPLVFQAKWESLYEEIREMKRLCDTQAHLKVILAAGELGNLENIYKAAMVAMMAGADFVKTSTGKETINATLPIGITMARAINDYYNRTGFKVGLKPAGGIKTSEDALAWMKLVKNILGNEWTNKNLFRFGASGLLNSIETDLFHFVYGRSPKLYELSFA